MHSFLTGSMRPIMTLVLSVTLAGCSSLAYQDPNQPAVPIGSNIQLNLNAEVALDENRIYIQNQMIVARSQIDEEQVYCSIVMQSYQETGKPQLKISPGEFSVWRVRLSNDYVYKPTIYATTGDSHYSPSFGIDFRTEIHLKSSDQPDVVALSCTEHRGQYRPPNRYPERPDFEAVLGDFVSLP